MKSKASVWSRTMCSAALVISGCSSTASVGKDTCIGEAIVCATDVEIRDYVLRSDNWPDGVATVDVQTVTPKAFYRPAVTPQARAVLAEGPGQTLWSATHEEETVLLEHVSREGELIESRRVPAPAQIYADPNMPLGGLRMPPTAILEVDAKHQPLLWLHYGGFDYESSSDQLFLFRDTLDEAPTHLKIKKLHPAELIAGVARTASGGVLIRGARISHNGSTFEGFVEKRDAQGKVVWRQTALANDLFYAEEGTSKPITALASGGVSTGRLDGFLDLDQDGNAVDAGRFVGPSLVAFQKILVAEDGRRIVAGPTSGEYGLGGDLAIVRLSQDSPPQHTGDDSWLIARQGYTNLSASALSTDRRGDVLIATGWGARLSLFEHRLICRLSHDHERDACFEVAEPGSSNGGGVPIPFSSLVSLEPGVVIVSGPQGLDRIELPEP